MTTSVPTPTTRNLLHPRCLLIVLVTILLVAILAINIDGAASAKKTTGSKKFKPRNTPLNVHLVPHSHNDVGWLKTIDQYYYGANASIDTGGVQFIYTNLVPYLMADSTRKFISVEIAFFSRWYLEQSPLIQSQVTQLINNRQLEFVNGGWCMSDEAAPYWLDILDQTALGHEFIVNNFGLAALPKATWQIDPFGHSSTHQQLSYQIGYDSMFVKRIDWTDLDQRQRAKKTEVVMATLQSNTEGLQNDGLFTGVLFYGYSAPDTYCFDERCTDEPIMADKRMNGYNLAERTQTYIERILEQAETIEGNEIMFLAGDDFNWMNVAQYLASLEKLMQAVNEDGRINIFYSTPSLYVEAKSAAQQTSSITYPVKTDDFFPYSNDAHAYWSGFYTSRPALKGMIRAISREYHTLRIMEYGLNAAGFYLQQPGEDPDVVGLLKMRKALAISQHHDAITGTSKQHVAFDYAQRLALGETIAQQSISNTTLAWITQNGFGNVTELMWCPLSNISICTPTQSLGSSVNGQNPVLTMMLFLTSSLFRPRTELIKFPVSVCTEGMYEVTNSSGSIVPSQISMNNPGDRSLNSQLSAQCELVFQAQMRTAATEVYQVTVVQAELMAEMMREQQEEKERIATMKKQQEKKKKHVINNKKQHQQQHSNNKKKHHTKPSSAASRILLQQPSDTLSISNNIYTVTFSTVTGLLTSITSSLINSSLSGSETMNITQDFFYYKSFGWGEDAEAEEKEGADYVSSPLNADVNYFQNSGAYIFRNLPSQQLVPIRSSTNAPVSVNITSNGPVVWEVQQTFSSWCTQTIRLIAGESNIEFEWTIGSVPIGDLLGKEVITRYTTSTVNPDSGIQSGTDFLTDSNGREMQSRVRFHRPSYNFTVTEPVAGEYYPITTAMAIQDNANQLTIVTDRAQGGSSLQSGALELMLHRRLLHDDNKGVNEPLNETSYISPYPNPIRQGKGLVVKGKHTMILSGVEQAASLWRPLHARKESAVQVQYGTLELPPQGQPIPPPGPFLPLPQPGLVENISPLPVNVDVVSMTSALNAQGQRTVLIRLAHAFSVGEDATLSQPMSIDLSQVLCCDILSVMEMSLTGVMTLEEMPKKIQWNVQEGDYQQQQQQQRAPRKPFDGTVVELNPMQIRTFNVTFGQ